MKSYMKKLTRLGPICIGLMLVVVIALSACGKSSKNAVIGEYYSNEGNYLRLDADGTCTYREEFIGSCSGTWTLEGNILTVNITALGETISTHADITEDTDGFTLESDGGGWTKEHFEKS